MSKKVLIAGASRGIGLELAVQYAAEGWEVIAACRDPEAARSWLPADVDLQKLDVTVASSIAGLAYHLDEAPLDLLIICAGIYGVDTQQFLSPSDQEFDQVMHTNVLGRMRMIQAFAPCVALARGKIVVMSSIMGSIGLASAANGMLYRASNAATNMIVKSAATEYGPEGATIISLHPGWVRTDMGGAEAELSVTESVEHTRKLIAEIHHDDNGKFMDYAGRALSW